LFLRLTALQPGQLTGLAGLRFLDLSNNLIAILQPGTFRDLPALISLRLSGNQLATLTENVFEGQCILSGYTRIHKSLFIEIFSNA
jgi:Leucine-rich repeat (LRR) protein